MSKFFPAFAARGLRLQRGVSVITAIFLLLLMSGLAAFMLNLTSVTNINLASDVGGTRAYQAARAGAEWAMFQLDPNGDTFSNVDLINCPASGGPSIAGYTVSVTCTAYPTGGGHYSEGSKNIRIFRVVSTAVATSAKAPVAERQIEVILEKCRDAAIATPPYDC